MKRLKFSLSYLFTALALLTSCINDDLSDCNRGVRVYFSYDGSSSQSLSSLDVSRITLLAFDASGRYVGEWIDEAPVLNADYNIPVPLDQGKYRFVAYAGLVSPCSLTPASPVAGETLFNQMAFNLDTRSDGAVTSVLSNIYHSYYPEFEVLAGVADQKVTLPLVEMTNRIHLTVEGLNTHTSEFSLRIDDKNGDYDLSNAFNSDRSLFYSSSCSKKAAEDVLESSLTVLRLSRDRRTPVLSLREETSDKAYYEENLISLILLLESKVGTIDFAKTHDFHITLTFDASLNVTVAINGWVLNEQSGPLS